MEKVRSGWKTLHNEEPYNLYSSPNIIRMIKKDMRESGHVACIGEMRYIHKILVGSPKENRPLGRPGSRLEANIRRDIREGVDGIYLVQNREQ